MSEALEIATDELEKELRKTLADIEYMAHCGKDMESLLTRCLDAIAWRSVEDGLPEKNERVLIRIKWGDSPAVASLNNKGDWLVDTEHVNCDGGWDGCTTHSDIENYQVTHWRPITPQDGNTGVK